MVGGVAARYGSRCTGGKIQRVTYTRATGSRKASSGSAAVGARLGAPDGAKARHGLAAKRKRGRRRVRYLRRCRSILFKYGQYLDFIMLLNGHRKPALYVDVPSSHASGDAFEPGHPQMALMQRVKRARDERARLGV